MNEPLSRLPTLSRRTLLAGAAAAGLTAGMPPVRAAGLRWDGEAEIVIVGSGGAGVSAALAEADKCALHLLRARSYRHERARTRHIRIVVGVNSYICTWKGFYNIAGDFFNIIGKRAAVCVAQSKAVRTAAQSRAQTFERVAVIVRHTVKEVLGVENDIFAVAFEKAAGLLYHR